MFRCWTAIIVVVALLGLASPAFAPVRPGANYWYASGSFQWTAYWDEGTGGWVVTDETGTDQLMVECEVDCPITTGGAGLLSLRAADGGEALTAEVAGSLNGNYPSWVGIANYNEAGSSFAETSTELPEENSVQWHFQLQGGPVVACELSSGPGGSVWQSPAALPGACNYTFFGTIKPKGGQGNSDYVRDSVWVVAPAM